MTPHDDILSAIGGTPLVRLARASDETGCTILGKAEFLNPGLSVKDRAALSIVRDAEARGLIRPGGTIVEGTAGTSTRSAPASLSACFFSADWVSGITITVR